MVDRAGHAWRILAGVAGAVVLAFMGAPQSLDMLVLVGPDNPELVGPQLAVGAAGAVATAVAVLLARRWQGLLVTGAVGVFVGLLLGDPAGPLLSVSVAVPDGVAEARLPVPVGVAMLLAAAAGVLVIGLLGVARELLRTTRTGASLAGFVGAAGYLGVAVIGPAGAADTAVRLAVAGVAAALTVVATARLRGMAPAVSARGWRVRYAAAGAVLASVLPTVVVALTGEVVFGTVTGGVTGLVVLAVALAASATAGRAGMLAVGATGLVLAAPVVVLLLIRDGVAGEVWYGWPVALAGVLLGAAVAARPWLATGVVAAAAVAMIPLALLFADGDDPATDQLVLVFLFFAMAAVAATVGTAATRFAGAVPAFGALATVAGIGVHASLSWFRIGPDGTADLDKTVGTPGQLVGAVLLLGAAALLGRSGVASRAAGSDAR